MTESQILFIVPTASLMLVFIAAVVAAVIAVMRKKDRIRNYSCAEAQLDMKNAQKRSHRRAREEANKMLFDVLGIIRVEARSEQCELRVDMGDLEKKYGFDPKTAKKRRNAVKDSLRSRGFIIIPDTQNNEELIHVSWLTSKADKGVGNG